MTERESMKMIVYIKSRNQLRSRRVSFHQCFPFCGSRLALLRKEINSAECLVNFFSGAQSIGSSSKLSRFINISFNNTKQLVKFDLHYNVEQNAPAY